MVGILPTSICLLFLGVRRNAAGVSLDVKVHWRRGSVRFLQGGREGGTPTLITSFAEGARAGLRRLALARESPQEGVKAPPACSRIVEEGQPPTPSSQFPLMKLTRASDVS